VKLGKLESSFISVIPLNMHISKHAYLKAFLHCLQDIGGFFMLENPYLHYSCPKLVHSGQDGVFKTGLNLILCPAQAGNNILQNELVFFHIRYSLILFSLLNKWAVFLS